MATKRQRKNEFHILAPRELSGLLIPVTLLPRELLGLLILVTLLPKDDNQCDAQNTSMDKFSILNNLRENIEEIVV